MDEVLLFYHIQIAMNTLSVSVPFLPGRALDHLPVPWLQTDLQVGCGVVEDPRAAAFERFHNPSVEEGMNLMYSASCPIYSCQRMHTLQS